MKTLLNYLIFFLLLAQVSQVDAQETSSSFETSTLRDLDDPLLVTRTHWISEMRQKLPGEFCAATAEPVLCYPVSESECRTLVQESYPPCLNAVSLPDKFNPVYEGELASLKVGECLSKRFTDKYGKKRKEIDECKFRRLDL